jgi:type II secretory pathway pseudopilin PulG
VIKNATQSVIYYDGTKVEYADTAVLTQFDTISGPLTVTGPTTLNGPVAIGNNGGLTIDATAFPDLTLGSIVEKGNYLTTGWDSSVGYDVLDQTILYNNDSSTSTFYVTIRGNGTSVPLSQILKDIGDTITCVYIIICSNTAHYCTSVEVDGTTTGVTTFWQGGAPPTAGIASARNVYTFTVMKVSATPTYQIFASLVAFDT